ncbi:MAG: hypothetical protein KGM24_12535, partial [Elusimicrobia bacterium]|nr:hypothetical protein [Elusimicrobiota bacterium]
ARAAPVGAEAADVPVVAVPTGTVVAAGERAAAPEIASVRVARKNVFDPAVKGEDWWPFRIADRIHLVTRERVVRRELLFRPGDRWDPLKVIESERNLRADYPFRLVEIEQIRRPDGRVDAVVHTQDSWSTNPRLSFGSSGGHSTLSYGLEEDNLAGLGKSVSYVHSRGSDTGGRTSSDSYGYGDPRFLGTRLALDSSFARTQDGDQGHLSLARPFYSLDDPRAMYASWSQSAAVGAEVADGADVSRYFERRRVVDAAYGWRLPGSRALVQRFSVGWYDDHAAFAPTARPPGTLPGTLPADRDLSGPTVGWSWVQPRYVKETYIDRMERVEDFNLGNELGARTGYMARGTGSDQDRWIFNVGDRQGLSLGPGRFLLAGVNASGRIYRDRWENGLLTADLNLFWKNSAFARDRTLVAHVEAAQGRRLDRENQIVLGGSSGLRGYKNDSFVGGRSVLANLEDRFFVPGEYFHLARFGGAVFAESGCVVPEGSGFSPARFKSDVGFGLRAASTRSTSGGVVRVDLAYALNAGPGGSRWILSIRGGQAFSFFNSASQSVSTSPGPGL